MSSGSHFDLRWVLRALPHLGFTFIWRVGGDVNESRDVRVGTSLCDDGPTTMTDEDAWTILALHDPSGRGHVMLQAGQRRYYVQISTLLPERIAMPIRDTQVFSRHPPE
jgi:hypothetical protein